ncbi:MAG: hypothetical protein HY900_04500 [Deltaproteobacteria bacterium]|nr:hypothetical protein [Deltaproteobacteria bacterium]
MDTKFWEQWVTLAAEALRGGEQARQALEALGSAPLTPQAVNAWIARWLPSARGLHHTDSAPEFIQRMEEWWKAYGLIPRARYLALLREHEELKAKVDELHETVRNLRELLAAPGAAGDAETTKTWEDLGSRLAEAQAQWTRAWVDAVLGAAPESSASSRKDKS